MFNPSAATGRTIRDIDTFIATGVLVAGQKYKVTKVQGKNSYRAGFVTLRTNDARNREVLVSHECCKPVPKTRIPDFL